MEKLYVLFGVLCAGIGLVHGTSFGYPVSGRSFGSRGDINRVITPFFQSGLNLFQNLQSRLSLPEGEEIIQDAPAKTPTKVAESPSSSISARVQARSQSTPRAQPTRPIASRNKVLQPLPNTPFLNSRTSPFSSIFQTFLKPFQYLNTYSRNNRLQPKVLLPEPSRPSRAQAQRRYQQKIKERYHQQKQQLQQNLQQTVSRKATKPDRDFTFITYLNHNKSKVQQVSSTQTCSTVTETVYQTVTNSVYIDRLTTIVETLTVLPQESSPELTSSTLVTNKVESIEQNVSPTTAYPPTSDLLTTEAILEAEAMTTTEKQVKAAARRLARLARAASAETKVSGRLRIKSPRSKGNTVQSKSSSSNLPPALRKLITFD